MRQPRRSKNKPRGFFGQEQRPSEHILTYISLGAPKLLALHQLPCSLTSTASSPWRGELGSSLCLAPAGRVKSHPHKRKRGEKREEEEEEETQMEEPGSEALAGRARREGGREGERGSRTQGYFCTIIQGKRAKLTGQ